MGVSFNKRRSRWVYDFELGGKRHYGYAVEQDGEPCRSRRAAERAEDRVRVAVENARRAPAPIPSTSYTVAEMFAAYIARIDDRSSNWPNQQGYIAELLTFFAPETAAVDVTEARVWEYIGWARKQPVLVWTGGGRKKADLTAKQRARYWKATGRTRADATINRYLTCLRKAIGIAHGARDALGRRLIEDPPKVPDLQEPDAMPRPFAAQDIDEVLKVAPPHVADAVRLSMLLGLRRSEVYRLTRQHVDFESNGIWLKPHETKANRGEFMPANASGMALLRRLVDQAKERGVDHLITWRRSEKQPYRPLKSPKKAIQNALKNAGLAGQRRFHDLKGTYTTNLAMVAPSKIVQRLARHKDPRTTERYIAIADEALRSAMEAFEGADVVRSAGAEGKVPDKAPDKTKEGAETAPRKRRLSA